MLKWSVAEDCEKVIPYYIHHFLHWSVTGTAGVKGVGGLPHEVSGRGRDEAQYSRRRHRRRGDV
jgi:hypothetical protein